MRQNKENKMKTWIGRSILSLTMLLSFACCTLCQAADGTATASNASYLTKWYGRDIISMPWDVTSSSVDGSVVLVSLGVINRPIVKVQYILDETDTPTALFDCYIYDSNDTIRTDLLGGAGVNASATANADITPLVGGAYGVQPTGKELFLSCSGMGNSKKFVLALWLLQ